MRSEDMPLKVTSAMKLRVGLVGLGEAWERRHLPALRALADRLEVRAVCEQVGRRAQLAAAEFGAQAIDGFRALAAREDVDAVLLLAPQWYGTLPILAACEHARRSTAVTACAWSRIRPTPSGSVSRAPVSSS